MLSCCVCADAFGRVDSKGARSTSLMDSSFIFCVYSVDKRSLASSRGHEQQQHLRWIPALHLIATACDLWYILPPYITIHHCQRVILHCRWLLCLPIHHGYSFIFHCTESWIMLRWTCQNTCFKADGPVPKSVQFHLQSELLCHSQKVQNHS